MLQLSGGWQFDGHGGSTASRLAAAQLVDHLGSTIGPSLQSKGARAATVEVEQLLQKAYKKTEDNIWRTGKCETCGTTAVRTPT